MEEGALFIIIIALLLSTSLWKVHYLCESTLIAFCQNSIITLWFCWMLVFLSIKDFLINWCLNDLISKLIAKSTVPLVTQLACIYSSVHVCVVCLVYTVMTWLCVKNVENLLSCWPIRWETFYAVEESPCWRCSKCKY